MECFVGSLFELKALFVPFASDKPELRTYRVKTKECDSSPCAVYIPNFSSFPTGTLTYVKTMQPTNYSPGSQKFC